jgi:hypothetical protein
MIVETSRAGRTLAIGSSGLRRGLGLATRADDESLRGHSTTGLAARSAVTTGGGLDEAIDGEAGTAIVGSMRCSAFRT